MSIAASDVGLSKVICPRLLGDRLPLLFEGELGRDGTDWEGLERSGMSESRGFASCAVFRGRPRPRAPRSGGGCAIWSISCMLACRFSPGRPRRERRPTPSTFSIVAAPLLFLAVGISLVVVEVLRFLEYGFPEVSASAGRGRPERSLMQ